MNQEIQRKKVKKMLLLKGLGKKLKRALLEATSRSCEWIENPAIQRNMVV